MLYSVNPKDVMPIGPITNQALCSQNITIRVPVGIYSHVRLALLRAADQYDYIALFRRSLTFQSLPKYNTSMNQEQKKKLRAYYHSLVEQQRFLNTLRGGSLVHFEAVRPLFMELALLKKEFPKLVPFNPEQPQLKPESRVNFIASMGMLSMVLGRLQAALEESTNVPVTEKREFKFVSNSDLKAIIERDYEEIQRAFIANCWKSVIILCGGSIEAILTDFLLINKTAAMSAKSAPKNNDVTRWNLSELIDVAVELKLVSAGMQKLSHPLREYRNLVHPSNEIRNKLDFGVEEARIAVEVLHILHRDLTH